MAAGTRHQTREVSAPVLTSETPEKVRPEEGKGQRKRNKKHGRENAETAREELVRSTSWRKENVSATCGRVPGEPGKETPDGTGPRKTVGSDGEGSSRPRKIAGPTGEEASGERRRRLKDFCCGSLEEPQPQASADSVAHWWFGGRVVHFLFARKCGIRVVG